MVKMNKCIIPFFVWGLILFSTNTLFSQQKNVLFIFIDDLNTELNCYGNSRIVSPNIDKLAEKGTIFKHAYCQWSVCGPSRASILSGQIPAQTGIQNLTTHIRDVNPNIITLPQYFKNNGFTTAAIGKVFDPRNVDDGHDSISWSLPYSIKYNYPAEYGSFVKGQYRVTENTATEMGPENVGDDGYIDGQICLDAISKLETFAAQPDVPFFLAVGFKKPHIPFIAPKKYWDLYQRDSLKLAPFQQMAEGSPEYAYFHAEPAQYDDIPDLWTYNDVSLGNGILDLPLQRKLIHGYYACVSYVDAQVGKLIGTLEELNLDENTIIVLLGDHGYHLGDHNQWGKHTNFESAVNAPLIIYSPQNNGAICETPVDFIDVYPTLTKLVFNEKPSHLSGNDLTPILTGGNITKNYSVSEYRSSGHSSYSLRNNRFRLTLWFKTSNNRPDKESWNPDNILEGELYDFLEDSLQTKNLYNDLAYKNIKEEIFGEAQLWWDKQYNHINNLGTGSYFKTEPEAPQIGNLIKNYFNVPESFGSVNLTVYDFQGRLVFKKNNQTGQVYFGNLNSGKYLVQLRQQNYDETLSVTIIKI